MVLLKHWYYRIANWEEEEKDKYYSIESDTILRINRDLHYSFPNQQKNQKSQCSKITEKVSFNIASEASYVYILSGQKLIKNATNGPFWWVFENLKLAVKQCYQTGQF